MNAAVATVISREDVPFTFVQGTQASMRRGEMFLHLVTHGSYHRGW
jgi:uncharacterized damage-inducible protein DinB